MFSERDREGKNFSILSSVSPSFCRGKRGREEILESNDFRRRNNVRGRERETRDRKRKADEKRERDGMRGTWVKCFMTPSHSLVLKRINLHLIRCENKRHIQETGSAMRTIRQWRRSRVFATKSMVIQDESLSIFSDWPKKKRKDMNEAPTRKSQDAGGIKMSSLTRVLLLSFFFLFFLSFNGLFRWRGHFYEILLLSLHFVNCVTASVNSKWSTNMILRIHLLSI